VTQAVLYLQLHRMDADMNMRSGTIRNQSGVLLVEVLISLLIFSIAVLGLVSMQAFASKSSADAEDRTRASTMASEIVALMMTQKSLTLPTTTVSAWQARLTNTTISGLPNAKGVISAPDVNNVVTITITWRAPSRKATDQNSQYVTQVSM